MSPRGVMKASGGMRAALVTGLMIGPALAVAACGQSDPSESKSTLESQSIAPASAKATGKPIVLGNIGTYSGLASSGTEYNPAILKFWASEVNGRGGINGHPIKLIIQDDGSDATKSLTEVKDLVENEHAIGFVGNYWSRTARASSPYLLSKGVPVVGGDSNITDPWFSNPMYFPIVPSIDKYGGGQVAGVAKALGLTKVALLRNDQGAASNGSADAFEKAVATGDYGMSIVLKQTIALSSANYQPNCLAARDAGAQGVVAILDTATWARLQVSCSRLNYNPTNLVFGTQLSTQQASVPKSVAAGMQGLFPFFLTKGSPALEEWGKATAGAPAGQVGNKTAATWVSAKLVEKALTAGVPEGETPTTAGLLKGLYSLKQETLGGLTVPLTYTKGKAADLPNCWFTYEMEQQKFTAPNLKATCA